MSEGINDATELARVEEVLRQERETFNQQKIHNARWFVLKLCMGFVGTLMLPGFALVCVYVLLNPRDYSASTVSLVAGTLLADLIAVIATVWKAILGTGGPKALAPITSHGTKSDKAVGAARRQRREASSDPSKREVGESSVQAE